MAKGLIYNTKLIGFQDNYSYNCLELFFDQDEIAMIFINKINPICDSVIEFLKTCQNIKDAKFEINIMQNLTTTLNSCDRNSFVINDECKCEIVLSSDFTYVTTELNYSPIYDIGSNVAYVNKSKRYVQKYPEDLGYCNCILKMKQL